LLPLNGKVVNLRAWFGEFGSHGHEEAVENVDRILAFHLYEPTVETTTQLHKLFGTLGLGPLSIHCICIDTKFFASVHSIVNIALCQRIRPAKTKLILELRIRHIQLVRLQNCCFGGDGIIVLVDELLLINDLAFDCSLFQDLDAFSFQTSLHQLLCLICHSMGLDENKRRILLV